MKRLMLAQQGFEELVPLLQDQLNEATPDRVETWLSREVGPVVAELICSRSFRANALWSVERLSPGSTAKERKLVQQVDRALVASATTLLEAATMAREIETRKGTKQSLDDSQLAALSLISGRPWFDLVCSMDFFHPTHDLHLIETSHHTELFRSQEYRVPLGDYVARLMFARIEYWRSIMAKIERTLQCSVLAGHDEAYYLNALLVQRHFELNEAIQLLRKACHKGNAARDREACTALTLVYLAYSIEPNLDWLGCERSWWEVAANQVRGCIRPMGELTIAERTSSGSLRVTGRRRVPLCVPATVRQIAAALHDVADLCEVPDDPEDLIRWACDRAQLVLVDRAPRDVFWEGNTAKSADWDGHPVEWNLLWTLAEVAGRTVDQDMLERPNKHTIRSRRSRLGKLLRQCLELDEKIESVRGQGYRLELHAGEVLLLKDNGFGRLEIIEPRRYSTSRIYLNPSKKRGILYRGVLSFAGRQSEI